MKTFEFHLQLSPEQYLDYYRGTARAVIVRCANGQTLQFPASYLQRYVTTEGIQGTFVMTCNDANKCIDFKKID